MKGSSFSVCMHILTLLAQFEGEYLSSAFIAESINMNPAMVRKEIAKLGKSALVESKEGKKGGVRLARPPADISLLDIFLVDHEREDHLLSIYRNDPHPQCTVGSQIQDKLSTLFGELDQAVYERLEGKTLAGFHRQFV